MGKSARSTQEHLCGQQADQHHRQVTIVEVSPQHSGPSADRRTKMASPSYAKQQHMVSARSVGLALLAVLGAAAAVDPSSWPEDTCQCTANASVTGLCAPATFYPPDIVAEAWESIGDQYVTILNDNSLTAQQRSTRYAPLISQTGLTEGNFTWYATKYAALKAIPSPQWLANSFSYCSVSYGDDGFTPCHCRGGGVAEFKLSVTEPVPIEFLTDADAAKATINQVLRDKLSAELGLWFGAVAVANHENGNSGDTRVTLHLTLTTRNKELMEAQFSALESLLSAAGTITTDDGSKSVILGDSNLEPKVLQCADLRPPSDLPDAVSTTQTEPVVAGASVTFTCPVGQKFSSGQTSVWRACGADQQLQPSGGDPLTCVDESATVATTSTAAPASSSTTSGSSRSTTTYVPDQYEEIDVDWNDGETIKKVDPNKPNLLLRITIPAFSVIFVMLILYLLCSRPNSCMCNLCGGGKLDEVV